MEFLHDMELNSAPTQNNHVTNKEYVDAAVAAAGNTMDYTYVDNGDANTLAAANAYTDAAVAAIPVCDCGAILAEANAYTDAAIAALPVYVDQAYVDSADASILVAAQDFTTDQIMNGLFFNGLTINGLYLNGLAEANAYTDAAVAAVVGIRKASGTLGDGMNNTCCFTHNLGTQDVIVQVRRPAQGGTAAQVVHPTIYIYDDNTVCCTFTAVPDVNGYNIVVIG